MRVLVIQLWTTDPAPIEASLRAAGIDAAITRVDFEAALGALLTHEQFDVAIFDPATPELTRERVEACFKLAERDTPLVVLADVSTIGAELSLLLAPRRN